MVMDSNYFSPLLAADFYLLFYYLIYRYWRRYRSSQFQQKYTSSFPNLIMVSKNWLFFLVEHICWRSNTWAGPLIWIESVALIAIAKVGSTVTHTDLLAVVGPQCAHICSYKGHLQKRHFSHPKGKKQSLIIYVYRSTSCIVCWISIVNYSAVSPSQEDTGIFLCVTL